MNASHDTVPFKLPRIAGGVGWRRYLDTTDPEMAHDDAAHAIGGVYQLPGRALILFACQPG
jgi:isoamylase